MLPHGPIGHHPFVVADQAVYLAGWPAFGGQGLCAFDGTQARSIDDFGSIFGLYGDDQRIITLTEDHRVVMTVDLDQWETIAANAPANGRCLCMLDERLYVGTADSHVWSNQMRTD